MGRLSKQHIERIPLNPYKISGTQTWHARKSLINFDDSANFEMNTLIYRDLYHCLPDIFRWFYQQSCLERLRDRESRSRRGSRDLRRGLDLEMGVWDHPAVKLFWLGKGGAP